MYYKCVIYLLLFCYKIFGEYYIISIKDKSDIQCNFCLSRIHFGRMHREAHASQLLHTSVATAEGNGCYMLPLYTSALPGMTGTVDVKLVSVGVIFFGRCQIGFYRRHIPFGRCKLGFCRRQIDFCRRHISFYQRQISFCWCHITFG